MDQTAIQTTTHRPTAANTLVARKFLTKMPDEVFNIYVGPLIAGHGWPFDASGKTLDVLGARRWFQMFDHQSVETIRQLSWKRLKLPFALTRFHPRSQEVVTALINLHVYGVNTFVTDIADTREKFLSARAYIKETGAMPVPVILQFDTRGFRILDGNHRIAAMTTLSNAATGIIDAWVGS